jgi:hypothetical protein
MLPIRLHFIELLEPPSSEDASASAPDSDTGPDSELRKAVSLCSKATLQRFTAGEVSKIVQ